VGEGQRVLIEFSNDLMTWGTLPTSEIIADPEGIDVLDPTANSNTRRFYRARVAN
jgi:hypothetical protein